MALRTCFFPLAMAVVTLLPNEGWARDWREYFRPSAPKVDSPEDSAARRRAQEAFLQRIRRSDPRYESIQKAVFNGRNELGIVLSHHVELDAIPRLMKALLSQMARAFPGEDLTIVAYAPAKPPLKIGTARFNARTRDMTYTAVRR